MAFPFRNMRDVLGLHAKVSPHKTALIHYDSQSNPYETSYLEFVGKSHQVANFLYEDLGIKRGDTIAIASTNQENALLLYLATWVIGATVYAINPATEDITIKQALIDSQSRVLFAEHSILERFISLANSLATIDGVIQIGGKESDDILRFEDLAANRPTTFLGDESGAKGADIPVTGGNERTARLSDIALVTCESDKLVRRSQGDLLQNANQYTQVSALTGNQVVLATLPFHQNFLEAIIAPLLIGATIVMTEIFSPDDFWHRIVSDKAHSAVLDTQRIQALVDTAREHISKGAMRFGGKIIQQDVKHFRYILTTDNTLTSRLACEFENIFGIPLVTAYKHPETDTLLTMLPINLAWTEHQQVLHGYDKPSIGVAIADITIVDDEDNLPSVNQTGFIAIHEDGDYVSTEQRGYFLENGDTRFYFLSE